MLNKQRIIALKRGEPSSLVGTIYPGQFNNNQVTDMGPINYGFFQDMYATSMATLSASTRDGSALFSVTRFSEGNLDNILTGSYLVTGTRSP